jgi:CubicO group peptidase (beta-lactamase class C family)
MSTSNQAQEIAAAGFSEVGSLLRSGVGTIYPAAGVLCRRGHATPYIEAVGDADAATWFDIASLTKALATSVLCMQAVAAGRLRLDEEVLPGVPIESLLRHESGLPAWLPLHALTPPPSRAELFAAARAAPREPAFLRAVYSDLGFILLADRLEQLHGQRLDALFHRLTAHLGCDLCYRPLDVAESSQRIAASRCAPTRRETPARELLQGVVHDDNARALLGVSGHAGLFGTLAGVADLGSALLDAYHGDKTPAAAALGIPPAIVRAFWAPPDPQSATPHAPGSTWGLGWDHPSPLPADSSPPTAPSSAGSLWPRDGVGHLGFTGCSLWLDPGPTRDQALTAVFLSNRVCVATPEGAAATQAGIKRLRPALHDAIYRALTSRALTDRALTGRALTDRAGD